LLKFLEVYSLFKIIFLLFILSFQNAFSQVFETTKPLVIDSSKTTIRTRFEPPKDFFWVKEEPGSFSEFLVNFPLHPPNFPVRDFRGNLILKQKNHVAILNIDVGEKDLQQCADAWIRLYA
jgi:hypothetical protein